MITTTTIGELDHLIGQTVTLAGWVQTIRNQKTVQFLILRDQTGLVQVTHVRQGEDDPLADAISHLTLESTIKVTGVVASNERVKLKNLEVALQEMEVLGPALSQLPIDETSALEHRLNWRFLDLRRPINLLMFKVQTTVEHAMRSYWYDHRFIEIHSPKFMGSPSESGAELFRVEYFGRNAYLAQSPQFYKQMAMASGFDRVFEIGPVFRANPSFTSRHDTEFTSVDMEMSWIDSHEDIMAFEEGWLRYVLNAVNEVHGKDISSMFGVDVIVPSVPFPRVTMEQAHSILAKRDHVVPAEGKGDLDPEGERILARHIQEETGHEFVFVTDYPTSVRPFYHMRQEGNDNITKSFDLIWKGLEITTGAQREHRYDILAQQARDKGLTLEPIQYYLDFFKYGCPPHGGFGFGLTRMLMMLLGLKNVREVTYLYRGPNRLEP